MLYSIFSRNKNKGLPREAKRSGGFTLTELIVVVAIATVIMAVLVIQQSKWNDQLAVNIQAYELTLMIRQAQIYSLGVKEDTGGSGDKFDIGYGVYVDMNNTGQYVFFADRNNDFKYNSGEAIETKIFTRGVTIQKICSVGAITGSEWCNDTTAWIPPFFGQLIIYKSSITFKRPEPKAAFKFTDSLDIDTTDLLEPKITIYLQSLNGKVSSIKTEANGQVSITQ